jgi:CheY-like chemotaxis protein
MEAIGTLAGGIAHDFNNILMGIQGRADLLTLTGGFDPGAREHLRAIEDAVASASGLTRQLLGFARGGKYQPRPLDLNDLVRASVELFGRTRKGLEISVECLATPLVGEVDGPQIEQVLLNLCVNAGQAMPDGGTLRLSTAAVDLAEAFCCRYQRPAGRYVAIVVADSGIGMDEATQQRIFDPFFSTKGPGRGSGLGLASVYGIVDNHQGIISVVSQLGVGTTFTIYLPLSHDAPTPLVRHDGEVRQGKETVLLIDDEQMILEVGAAMLGSLGYRVFTAHSGELALRCLEERGGEVDLVVLDLIMPGMDGAAVFAEIHHRHPLLPVVLSSGYAIDDVAKEILANGCRAFIQKPFSLVALSQQLRLVFDEYGRVISHGEKKAS